jgi:ketosteroid isomerase-like protein
MRKTVWLGAVQIIVLITIPIRVHGQTPQVRQQFEALLRRSDEVIARKDAKGVMATFTDDFRGEDIEGNIYNKEIARKSLEASFSFAQSLRSRTQLQEVKLVRGEAVALTKEHTELRIPGRTTGWIHTLVFDGTWRSIWIKTESGWKVRHQKQLSQTITQDGKSRVVAPKATKGS